MLSSQKLSIISDQRSAISDQAQTYTKTNKSTHVTAAESTLAELSAKISVDSNLLLTLNPQLNKTAKIPAGTIIQLPPSAPLIINSAIPSNAIQITTLPSLGGIEVTEPVSILGQTSVSQYVTNSTETNVANAAQIVATTNWESLTIEEAKAEAESYAKNQAESYVKSKIQTSIITPIEDEANELLGLFGKGQIKLSVDDEGSLKESSLNILSPLYDEEKDLIFSQVGVNGLSDSFIGNFGIGYRHEEEKYLIGTNAFIDADFENQHTRGGFGLEFWTDAAKIANNYYFPISGWKSTDELEGYEARPAKGFDLRLQTFLPDYPQLGGSLMYEQYFGDEVALFGKENLQNDPYAFTVGIDYMPIPLMIFKGSYKEGQDSKSEGRFDALVNLQIGTPLEQQLNPDNVALARSLKGSRYDIVDRNYDIVLEYRKKDYSLAANFNQTSYEVAEKTVLNLIAEQYLSIEKTYTLEGCPTWEQPFSASQNLSSQTLVINNECSTNPNDWQIQIPAYLEIDTTSPNYGVNFRIDGNGQPIPDVLQNTYELALTIKDIKGKTAHANVKFIVLPPGSSIPSPNGYPSTNLEIRIYDRGVEGTDTRPAMPVGANAILPNRYYEAVIIDKDKTGPAADVTAWFDKYIRWSYYVGDTTVGNSDGYILLDQSNNDLGQPGRCTGTILFPTQVTNTVNVETAILVIVGNLMNSWINYEQGLSLVPTLDLPQDIIDGTKQLEKTPEGQMQACNDRSIYKDIITNQFPVSELNK